MVENTFTGHREKNLDIRISEFKVSIVDAQKASGQQTQHLEVSCKTAHKPIEWRLKKANQQL
jgi:hypothetical protein